MEKQYREFAEECDRLARETKTRFWRIWLRLGEWWLRRVRVKRVSSQPIAFRQHRLRVLLPGEATLVTYVAAKPALAYLRQCVLVPCKLEQR
jgi:hypothetical protein